MLSLPLLPEEYFVEGFNSIKKQAEDFEVYEKMELFFEYFESFWIPTVNLFLYVRKSTFNYKFQM